MEKRRRWSTERRFYVGLTTALAAAVFLGFSRTFFLRAWFPDWAEAHGAPEAFFYVHGVVFAAWFLLLLAQPLLIGVGRVDLHRRLGWLGGCLAVAMVILGTVAALKAAARPTGFIDIPMPPLEFLIVPLADIALFGVFVAFAVVNRRNSQSHKRYMLLASIALVEASVGRWPFALMKAKSPVPGLSMIDLGVDLFVATMVVWDIASRRRVHPVTLWGGATLIAFQLLRFALAETRAWHAFAGWAVSLLGH